MKKEKFLRTKEDIRQNNRVLRIANSTRRVFVVFTSREFNHPFRGQGGVIFVKRGREYNPAFDCDFWPERPSPARNRKPEYGKLYRVILMMDLICVLLAIQATARTPFGIKVQIW